SETILSPFNLVTCLIFLLIIPFFLAAMHPRDEDVIEINAHLMDAFRDGPGDAGPEAGGAPALAHAAPAGADDFGPPLGGGVEGGAVATAPATRVPAGKVFATPPPRV